MNNHPPRPRNKVVTRELHLEPKLWKALQQLGRSKHMTPSMMLNELVKEEMKRSKIEL